jgi:hypothetical protein
MPRREDLKAQVTRELRAAVATQRRRDDAGGGPPFPTGAPTRPDLTARVNSRGGSFRIRARVPRAEAVARWLYPLPKRITLEGFAVLTRPGQLTSDPWWAVTANRRRIRAGDFVYVYTEEENAGIVGFAIVGATRTTARGRSMVQLRIDARLSQRLVKERPIAAASIRRWLPPRKRAVENLAAFSHRLDLMLSRFYGHGGHLRRAHKRSSSTA